METGRRENLQKYTHSLNIAFRTASLTTHKDLASFSGVYATGSSHKYAEEQLDLLSFVPVVEGSDSHFLSLTTIESIRDIWTSAAIQQQQQQRRNRRREID